MLDHGLVTRRAVLETAAAAMAAGWTLAEVRSDDQIAGNLRLATFRLDVTPPIGHSCCGGWIKPVEVVDDALEAVGVVLLGGAAPVVLCAVDWTGILNEAHLKWREALARGAGTTADRVAVHCVHQHNAPLACLEAERLVKQQGDLPDIVNINYFADCLQRAESAVAAAVRDARPVTHVASGQAKVEQVAGNRRVARDATGRVLKMRGSACRDPELLSLPEGVIDPWLKTVAFYHQDEKLAALHYYATHPMSYYGDGRVSSDFVGLARKRRQADEPNCAQLYFTGCAGNVAAGKYNDGSTAARPMLTQRMYAGIVASEQALTKTPAQGFRWSTIELLPPPRETLVAATLAEQVANKSNAVVNRNRPSYMLSWLRRLEQRLPIVLSALHINDISLLHLPGESFVEYQLRAQQTSPHRFVATAAYGDGGPWYIPTKEEYPHGGYEVSVAFAGPEIDDLISDGMRKLLT